MKVVLVLILVLLLVFGVYLFSIQASTVQQSNSVIDTPSASEVVADEMCTSTACMKKSQQPVVSPPKGIKKYTEFVNPSGFVNSEPFAMADYVGKKVILVEFITYSCINCQRTFPFMKQWHETYAKDGLMVIGIHTPEFAYERDRDNVIAAMKKEGITFPVVQDNDYETWNAYKNRFWPHRYIIDYEGNVVFDHIGEGAYAETEAVIQNLLQKKPVGV
jgi:thiol-disulfide isomerase/thioredoxin